MQNADNNRLCKQLCFGKTLKTNNYCNRPMLEVRYKF